MDIIKRYIQWNWAWNLDSGLRYGPLIQLIKIYKPKNIVEVGSGNRGISSYAHVPSYGIDIDFNSEIKAGLQERICTSGDELPFSDDSMDIVLSADMLEHVSDEMRPRIVQEMFRVVNPEGLLYIAVPCGKTSEEADRRVYDAFIEVKGKEHPMLVDHVEHGLPSKNEIKSIVDGIATYYGWKVEVSENTPVWLWELNLMCFAVERWLPGLRHFQRLILQPLFPILSKLKSENNYRVILVCTKASSQ